MRDYLTSDKASRSRWIWAEVGEALEALIPIRRTKKTRKLVMTAEKAKAVMTGSELFFIVDRIQMQFLEKFLKVSTHVASADSVANFADIARGDNAFGQKSGEKD